MGLVYDVASHRVVHRLARVCRQDSNQGRSTSVVKQMCSSIGAEPGPLSVSNPLDDILSEST